MNAIQSAIDLVESQNQELVGYMRKLRENGTKDSYEKAHTFPASFAHRWPRISIDDVLKETTCAPQNKLRLYIHVPWCVRKCVYCNYDIDLGVPDKNSVSSFTNSVGKELDFWLKNFENRAFVVDTLYIGGGTPSILNEEQINELFGTLEGKLIFTDDSTLATEISPGTITEGKVRAFVENGVNRISMGIQTFQDRLLKVCRRDHNSNKIYEAYSLLNSLPIDEINLDLMTGLPNQTYEDFEDDVRRALELAPTSLSFLDLRIGHLSDLCHSPKIDIPSFKDMLVMRALYSILVGSDLRYVRTRPHYYVRPEKSKSHTTRVPCLDSRVDNAFQIGVGPSAYSHLGDFVFQNAFTDEYYGLVEQGDSPVVRGMKLEYEDKTAMKAIRSIVDLMQVPILREEYKDKLDFLIEQGLLVRNNGNKLVLTDRGCLFGEELCYMFYPSKFLGEENG